MTPQLNYSSNKVDENLGAKFEAELVAARSFTDATSHLIGGHWLGEGKIATHADPCNPSRTAAQYHTASDELVDRAVSAARKASIEWRNENYASRCKLLREAKAVFSKRQAELAGIVSAETGKVRVESLAEVAEAIDLIEYYASQTEEKKGFTVELKPAGNESRADVLRPFGIFGVIVPFNFPIALAVNMVVAALVTGNTVVVKPSNKTPRSTTEAIAVIAKLLPAGVVNIVQGDVATGEKLVASDVDGIAFTGSAEVGWDIVHKLQKGPTRKPVLAEMGGQNPAIVTASADLTAATAGIIRSAFGLSGQKCSSCRRVIVERSVADELKKRLIAAAKDLKLGDPSNPETNLGPVIDKSIASRLDTALSAAKKDGTILTGGRDEALSGYFYAPAIVSDLPPSHSLTRDELFAPFLTVTVVESFDDAMREANAVQYGLSAGIYTANEKEKERFLDEIEAGVIYVNRAAGATTGAWPGAQPFCGWKSSGSSGKGGLGPWYLPGFMREQSRTIVS